MAVKIRAEYVGDDRVELSHGPSKSLIVTDLPEDNGGRGRSFSPTDLLAASLSSCILSIMAMAARKDGIPFEGASMELEKEMSANPRRVARIVGTVALPKGLTEAQRAKLMAVVQACPVHRSLHPELKVELKAD